MGLTVKKITRVTTTTVQVDGEKKVETTETVTSTSDASDADVAKFEAEMAEFDRTTQESTAAMNRAFEGFSERIAEAFKPFERLHRKTKP